MGSWTALQSIASTVLGGDIEASSTTIGGSKPATHRRKNSTAWGPDGLPKKKPDNIGFGTASDTEAKIRAKKMRGVLEGGDEDLNARKDANGNYKRRTSSDEARSTPAEEDAMVYIHHVQPSDTLAGVILKYNCEPSVFRKANRFWPNDSIQTKKVVVVPVDACTIRGRPCDSPVPGERGVDLLSPTPSAEDPPTFNNGATWPGVSPQVGTSTANAKSEDQPWVHVRWVLIDSSPFSKPAEIARMPRKTLGYFPPRRRKSQGSVVSTPRASMDFSSFSQSPPSHRGTPPSRVGTTSGGSYFPPPAIRPGRPRRESVSEAADRLGWMRGPGGVGTLTGKNVRKPGPSQDGLNAWAKKHVPGLAIDFLPSASLVGGETARFGFDGSEEPMRALTPGPGGTSGIVTPSGAGLGIENAVAAAAAIEGWVRRLAIKPGTPRMTGRAQESDSIELLDGAGSDDGRCELTPRGRLVTVGALCDTDDVVRRGKGKKGD
ncbi:hypothetical protein BJ878DRAFT_510905 [Calycina marina]|uniref:LysM domain-containing protein n=1 Tax=Calycina marina TaxID=1763456 RepID=A0A9P7Z176_9HELO|nr:hypothetical protein BJ878DRAFT_510905 [Calycina marina]